MGKKILFLILIGALVLPLAALAADNPTTITTLVDAAVNTTLYIASGVVVILWVITGLLFLTAQGQPEKLKQARTSLIAAVAGTALVILAVSAVSVVGSAFNLKTK